ncbi:MAG: hypothetical protein AAF489_00650 [Bacteroidota bacterium]
MTLLDICITAIVFLIGYNLKNFSKGASKPEKKILNQLFFFHFGIAIIFHFYISSFGGDAVHYWDAPKEMSLEAIMNVVNRGSATGLMYLINYIPSHLLQLSFFTGNMMYALLGYLGFVYILRTTKYIFGDFTELAELKLFGIPIFPWIWFLPNFHFWSSGIGKDAILFFSIALFVYCLQNLRKRWLLLLISIVVSLAIRPHIMLFLLACFGIGFTMDGSLKAYQKLFVFAVFIVGFLSIFNYVLEFIQLESLEATAIDEYTSTRSSNLNKSRTGSGVDITNYSFPLKAFTFLYRPLFFDINGILAVVASIENFILLCFSGLIFFKKPYWAFKKSTFLIKGILLYFLLGTVAFSLILGNLGIMLRQKNMLMPWLIIFGLWTFYSFSKNKRAIYANPTGNK